MALTVICDLLKELISSRDCISIKKNEVRPKIIVGHFRMVFVFVYYAIGSQTICSIKAGFNISTSLQVHNSGHGV